MDWKQYALHSATLSVVILLLLVAAGCRERSPGPNPQKELTEKTSLHSAPDQKDSAHQKDSAENPSGNRLRHIPKSPELTPRELLARTVNAYKTAKSYSDHGRVRVIGQMKEPNAEPVSWPCTVAYQSSGKLRLEVNEGMLVSDGNECFAQVRSMPGQVLQFATPQPWTLESLFYDVQLDRAMDPGVPATILRFPPQLVFLMAKDPLKTLLPENASAEILEPQWLEDKPCDLLRITGTDGSRILWICRQNTALLRLEYVVEGLPVPEEFESIRSIQIDLADAQFNQQIGPEAFQMLQPDNARHVPQFQPTETLLLGTPLQPPDQICLRTIWGKTHETKEQNTAPLPPLSAPPVLDPMFSSLLDKAVVLCFWTTWSDSSAAALREISETNKVFSQDERILFVSINADVQRAEHNENEKEGLYRNLRQTLKQWNIDTLVCEDVGGILADALLVDSYPTIAILAPGGVVEFYYRGIVPVALLENVVRAVLAGEKPSENLLAFFKQQQDQHNSDLRRMSETDYYADSFEKAHLDSKPSPAPPVSPKHFSLEERWIQPLTAPRNIAVLPGRPLPDGTRSPQRILVSCEGNVLAVFDIAGKLLHRAKPEEIPDDEMLVPLHVGTDALGKVYVGTNSIGGRVVYVFDDELNFISACSPGQTGQNKVGHLESEPPQFDRQPQIVADFQFVNSYRNRTQALVLGLIGLDDARPGSGDALLAIDLEGKELWRDQAVSSPVQICAFQEDGRHGVYCLDHAEDRDTIVKFDSLGVRWTPFGVDARFDVLWFETGELMEGATSGLCTILYDREQQRTLFAALDCTGKILWEHPLPSGEYQRPINRILAADLIGNSQKEWIVSAPDGTIYIFDWSGQLLDSFSFGELPSRLTVVSEGNQRILVVATDNAIVAWE